MSNGYPHQNLDPNLMGVQNSMEYNAAGEPSLRVIANPNGGWGIQVSNGDVEGVSYIEKFGRSSDIPNGDVTLWDGNTRYDYLTTAATVTVTIIQQTMQLEVQVQTQLKFKD